MKYWEHSTESQLLELSEPFLGTWQTSGTMLDGQVYELVMPERHINASESSSLPTPTVSDQYTANLSSTQQKPGSMHSVTLAQVFHKPELFPTPTTRDYKDGSAEHERDGKVQTDTVARAVFNSGEVLLGTPRATAANSSSKQVELGAPKARIEDQVKLLPTPLTTDGRINNSDGAWRRDNPGLGTMVHHTNWGKFEPAIRRWEAVMADLHQSQPSQTAKMETIDSHLSSQSG